MSRRLPAGGRIDRTRPVPFTWDGRDLTGFAGDTLASALLANDVRVVGRSFKYHRPRGIFSAGVEEPNAIVDLSWGERHDPNARATMVALESGMAARGLNGTPNVRHDLYRAVDLFHRFMPAGFYYKTFMRPKWGTWEPRVRAMAGLGMLRATPDPRHYETRSAHCDVLVVGGGPAGLAAARAAAASGLSVIVVDERPDWGGSLLWNERAIDDRPASVWAAETVAELARRDTVRLLGRTSAFGYYDDNAVGLLEQRPSAAAGWAEERLWTVRARQVVLATGAIERPLVFPDNDRPGVMLAGAALQYLRQYAVLAGDRVVVATNNDSAYETALALRLAGAMVTLADVREAPAAAAAAEAAGVRVLPGSVVLRTGDAGGLRWVEVGPVGARSAREAKERLPATLLASSGGWTPSVHLFSQAEGKLDWNEALATFVPRAPLAGQQLAGAITGAASLADCLAAGHQAGLAAAQASQHSVTLAPPRAAAEPEPQPLRAYWHVPAKDTRQWVDLQSDVTSKDIALAAQEHYVSVEHLKRYTTLGMSADQGKTSAVNAVALLAEFSGQPITAVGTTTFRPPYTGVSMGALTGLRHGRFHSALRLLPANEEHAALAADMRDYGGWSRPACYPRQGESIPDAIRREALAVRREVGLLDGSSLGKILAQGPDAAAFLNLIYYNEVATLKPGRLRYCLLLQETGIVFDDGVVARLGPDRFLLSPSSSHTAGVLAGLERWRQTEYPSLCVAFHDVTAAWATVAVSGPKAREVVRGLTTDIDLSDAALPHMALAEGDIEGVRGRIARVSFSGERGFEVSVPSSYGASLWRRLRELGEPHGIVPYGLEALTILRMEKGYIMIGVDTDGMTLPGDLGMTAPLRTKAVDFVGKRSLLTPEAIRTDRRQFVGLRPADPTYVPPAGSHAVVTENGKRRSIGWVTSACHSPILGRSIGLGMIERGRELAASGAEVELFHFGQITRATLCSPVFYDEKGEKLHG